MHLIKGWALSLVLVSVLGSIVLILSPSGTVEKQLRTAVSLVMLVCLVSPFLSGFDNGNIFKEDVLQSINTNIEITENPVAEIFAENLENQIIDYLFQKGISPLSVLIKIHRNEYNDLQIDSVNISISVDDAENIDEIYNLLREKYGILATVEVVD